MRDLDNTFGDLHSQIVGMRNLGDAGIDIETGRLIFCKSCLNFYWSLRLTSFNVWMCWQS